MNSNFVTSCSIASQPKAMDALAYRCHTSFTVAVRAVAMASVWLDLSSP